MLRVSRVRCSQGLRSVGRFASSASHDQEAAAPVEEKMPPASGGDSGAARRLGRLAWVERGPLMGGMALSSMAAGLQLLFPKVRLMARLKADIYCYVYICS